LDFVAERWLALRNDFHWNNSEDSVRVAVESASGAAGPTLKKGSWMRAAVVV
jgi:fumarylacetoacetate (FAA) hydrolase family protein